MLRRGEASLRNRCVYQPPLVAESDLHTHYNEGGSVAGTSPPIVAESLRVPGGWEAESLRG